MVTAKCRGRSEEVRMGFGDMGGGDVRGGMTRGSAQRGPHLMSFIP